MKQNTKNIYIRPKSSHIRNNNNESKNIFSTNPNNYNIKKRMPSPLHPSSINFNNNINNNYKNIKNQNDKEKWIKDFLQKNTEIKTNNNINIAKRLEYKNNKFNYFNNNFRQNTKIKNSYKDETFINIIYLIDTTYSMKKNKDIIYSIKNINDSLKSFYKNIQFGFVLYKDFFIEQFTLKLNQSHIKVYPISEETFINEEINFIGGYDYAEDWANAYYEISQLKFNEKYENIIIHFCDSGAHGKRFSDYDSKNKQENLLIQALNYCSEKGFKIIGLLYNEFSRKSFLACAKLYKGYYNLVDLTLDDLRLEYNFQNIIFENINHALKNEKNMTVFDDFSQITNFEDDFKWGKIIVNMEKLKNIKNLYYNNFYYIFLPILNGAEIKEINNFVKTSLIPYFEHKEGNYDYIRIGLKQGSIGDCFLIAPIISIIYNKIPLTEYIFPKIDYDQDTENIEMNIYENGIRKLITFKNTYASHNNNFIFSSPLNNVFFGISIEKGYAVNNSNKKNIKSGFDIINKGGFSFNVFNSLFGASSEIFRKSENKIQKEKLKNKIMKYFDFNGLITFGVRFNISGGGHAFSIIGYKIYQNGEFYIEILNPWHKGYYLENNIKKNDEYNKISRPIKIKFDQEKNGKNISEEEFKNNEKIYNIFNNYGNTGFLTLKLNTFFNWFNIICFCDPMLGYLESIVEVEKGGNNIIYFKITKETKFRAFLLESENKIDDLKDQMKSFKYKIEDNSKKYSIRLDKDYDDQNNNINIGIKKYGNLIYEKLKPGIYIIEINPYRIDKYLYLKIQANDIIIYDKKRKDDLSNGIMSRNNCNCLNENNIYYKECYFCQIYRAYQLIDKIVKSLNDLINYYHNYIYDKNNNNNYEIYNELLPDYQKYNVYNKLYYHLYYHYMSTKDGFIVLIINKFRFNWDCKTRIEYNKYNQEFNAFFEFGNFKITENLIAFNYENSKFKNILNSLDYHEKSFDLSNIYCFFKKKEKFESKKQLKEQNINQIYVNPMIKQKQNLNQIILSKIVIEQQNFVQIHSKKIIEQEKLEQILSQIVIEQRKLEQIKSQYSLEIKNLEQIKNKNKIQQQFLDQLRKARDQEQKDLENIKLSLQKDEQSNFDKINDQLNFLDNILTNLEESKINFDNIGGASCYQSSTLQVFVHIIYPKAIRKLNEEKIKKGEPIIQNLDEFKNNIKFNDIIIDILKEINNKENERKNNLNNKKKNYKAYEIFDKFPPEKGRSQSLLNEYDCNKLHKLLFNDNKIDNSYPVNKNSKLIQKDTLDNIIIKINKSTPFSDILKFKVENEYYGNLVLQLNENDIKDTNLNFFKLIKNCPQLKNYSNNYNHKKITEISDIIYIFIDRVENSKGISKKFSLPEKLYYDKISQNLTDICFNNYLLYEIQFIIYHSSCSLSSGHYVAYQKIKGEWYFFDDTESGYAKKRSPNLNDTNEYSYFPVIIYYVLKK